MVYLTYNSEAEYIEDKCSYFTIVIPSKCEETFEEAKQIASNQMKELFSDDYEQYFIRIDLTREYREKIKAENVIKKKRFAWKQKENIEIEFEDVKSEKGKTFY